MKQLLREIENDDEIYYQDRIMSFIEFCEKLYEPDKAKEPTKVSINRKLNIKDTKN